MKGYPRFGCPFLIEEMTGIMYRYCENIRIRNCDEMSFYVNISDNSFFALKTNAMEYLDAKLNEGLTKEKLADSDLRFKEFVETLVSQRILEVSGES